jgi:hypothetical protein
MNIFRIRLLGIGLILVVVSSFAFAGETKSKNRKRSTVPVHIKVVPLGPSQALLDAAKLRAEKSPAVQALVKGTKFRTIYFGLADTDAEAAPRFQATIYDYTNDRTLVAEGDLAGREAITVREEVFQPIPSDEEFDEAVSILKKDERFVSLFKDNIVRAFRAMPDITVLDGTKERLVNVGLDSVAGDKNEVVSVSIARGIVIRYESGAPLTSRAAPEACGIGDAGQGTTSAGTAGQFNLTVTQGETLWEMTVVRPSASSGTRRSGIEIRDVKYKGKLVMKRGHAPVLNVQYPGGQCGPFRDWMYQEDMFQTPSAGNTDPAPGIRIVAPGQIATTALESGQDTGNFKGVAIYNQDVGNGMETVLITELQAGWYRYIMEWRFAPNGTIRPRYGFGAVDSSCVCFVHNHHVYWRFDMDVVNPTNRVYQMERGRRFQTPILNEMFLNKNNATNRKILVQNSTGNEAYEIVPSVTDGVVDVFGVHDMWVLRYKTVVGGTALQNEIDDGFNQTTSQNAFIQIDSFLNNESVVDQDVVVWYGAHFIHSDQANRPGSPEVLGTYHVVGPDLRPVRW